MVNWNASSFLDECLRSFAVLTNEFSGFWHLAPRTRLLAYARTAFEDLAGEDNWTGRIERDLMDLLDRELSDESKFLTYGTAVTAFASYVYGVIEAKTFLGEFDRAHTLAAQFQLAGYDFLHMEKIHDVYEKALRGELPAG